VVGSTYDVTNLSSCGFFQIGGSTAFSATVSETVEEVGSAGTASNAGDAPLPSTGVGL
jgi:hypothetical protein